MYVLVDDREIVVNGYAANLNNHGVAAFGFSADEFRGWIRHAAEDDLRAVEAFLIGQCENAAELPEVIRTRSRGPIIALVEREGLEKILTLFNAGADDVLRKPVHVREIMARVGAVHRRATEATEDEYATVGNIRVFFDGRDPEVCDKPFPLPRRERRILEFLVASRGRRVSRTQIFNAVYGVFNEEIDETVIESHISKLRKKLRAVLGADPISSKRYLGYGLTAALPDTDEEYRVPAENALLTQEPQQAEPQLGEMSR